MGYEIAPPRCTRVNQQKQFISEGSGKKLRGKQGLTVVEMGCGKGWFLYSFRHFAARGGRLICIDQNADPHMRMLMEAAKAEIPGLTYEIKHELFDGATEFGSGGIDMFLSSHAL